MSADRRLGIIGDPVAHSLSPAIQQPALDALGVAARYELWPTTAAELPERIKGLRTPDALGANVTVPHKQAVMPLLDEVAPLAARAGAVNTIVNRDGRLIGDNTDIEGFASALRERCADVADRSALILGAGGAARAVVLALDSLGVRAITIANRHPERGERLAADLNVPSCQVVSLDPPVIQPAMARSGLLVNATSLGWHPGETPVSLEDVALLPAEALVVDLTYRDTALLQCASQHALATLDGLSMLVRQGARSLELWIGQPAPLHVMWEAALRARDDRAP